VCNTIAFGSKNWCSGLTRCLRVRERQLRLPVVSFSIRMPLRVLLPALLLLASTAFAAESGAPLITVLRQEQHTGGTQTFEVTRDARGRLFFANGDGILIHDGAWWTRLDLPSSVFSVAADAKGRVGLTLLDDLGVLARGPAGTLAYQSLLPQVPRELRSGLGRRPQRHSALASLQRDRRPRFHRRPHRLAGARRPDEVRRQAHRRRPARPRHRAQRRVVPLR
jgi:hypothetical protein